MSHLAIVGQPGSLKTTIALYYAYEKLVANEDMRVFYFCSDQKFKLNTFQFAKKTAVDVVVLDRLDVRLVESFTEYVNCLTMLTQHSVPQSLLIFDDIDHLAHRFQDLALLFHLARSINKEVMVISSRTDMAMMNFLKYLHYQIAESKTLPKLQLLVVDIVKLFDKNIITHKQALITSITSMLN